MNALTLENITPRKKKVSGMMGLTTNPISSVEIRTRVQTSASSMHSKTSCNPPNNLPHCEHLPGIPEKKIVSNTLCNLCEGMQEKWCGRQETDLERTPHGTTSRGGILSSTKPQELGSTNCFNVANHSGIRHWRHCRQEKNECTNPSNAISGAYCGL
jgi:hypothetical protein